MKRLLTNIVLFFIACNSLFAFFETDIKKLTMQNGLADNTVFAIIKDKDGFMWFGTEKGLSRYDGTQIRNFHLEDSHSHVTSLSNGQNHILWTVIDGKLVCFDRSTEDFFVPKADVELRNVSIVIATSDSTLCIISDYKLHLLKINYEEGKNNNILLTSCFIFDSLANNKRLFSSINSSSHGHIIAVTNKGEIVEIDEKTGEITAIHTIDELDNLHISGLYYDKQTVWILTWTQGVYILNLENGEYIQYAHSSQSDKNISHTDVYGVAKIDENRFVAASWNGYTLFTPQIGQELMYKTKVYNNTASHIHRTLETHMISIFYDPNGILWIGTQGGGVFASDLRKQLHKQYFQDTHNAIHAIENNDLGDIFLGTFHNGLMKSKGRNSASGELSFEQVKIPELKENVFALAKDGNKLWIGGGQSCLVSYNIENGGYKVYQSDGVLDGEIRCLLKANDSTLWIGCNNLIKFDLLSKKFIPYNIPYHQIRAIKQDKNQRLWLGTAHGLIQFDPNTNEIYAGYEAKKKIPTQVVKSMVLTSDQKIYVGYNNGFAVFSIKEDSLTKYFSTHNGLNNNYIGTIVEDSDQQIWLGSNSGISRYSKTQDIFYHYYISGSNSSSLCFNDVLYFGNNINLTYFYPKNLFPKDVINNRTIITKLEVNKEEVGVGKIVNNQEILDKSVFLKDSIILNHSNNSFSISFSNLRYDNIQKYRYRFIPYINTWSIAEEGEKISYPFLEHGEYTFQVQSILHNVDEGSLTQLHVTVLPKWSETIWFRISILILIASLFMYVIVKAKKRNIRKIKEQVWKEELLIASMENEREKKINQERSAFFTSVSHELRTPLTLIKGPLQDIIEREDIPQDIGEDLDRVYTNAQSLSTLVDRLLYLQKAEAGFVKLQIREIDILNIVTRVFNSFKDWSDNQQICFQKNFHVDELIMWIDEEKIETTLNNLISNAFKYTKDRGSVSIDVSRVEIDEMDHCQLSVSDTGTGIEEALQSKIFDPFVIGSNVPTYSTQVGIGLRIVKNNVELHHGQILLESTLEKGSTFTILLPIGKEFYNDDDRVTIHSALPENSSIRKSDYISEQQTLVAKGGTGNKILIIEDNNEIRQYIRSLFLSDYDVVEADNGKDGVELIISELPHIVLTDIMMPQKDGYDVLKEIKKNKETAHIPVLMLTAKAGETDIIEGLSIGADDYIMKPFNPQILKIKVANLIRSRLQLKRIYTRFIMQTDAKMNADENPFLQELINVVEQNIDDPYFSVTQLAEIFNMSQSTLYRRIKDFSDLSAKDIIRNVRITKAAMLIRQKRYQIQEVANMVGYNDLSSFRKHFTKQFGIVPSLYDAELGDQNY